MFCTLAYSLLRETWASSLFLCNWLASCHNADVWSVVEVKICTHRKCRKWMDTGKVPFVSKSNTCMPIYVLIAVCSPHNFYDLYLKPSPTSRKGERSPRTGIYCSWSISIISLLKPCTLCKHGGEVNSVYKFYDFIPLLLII